MEQLADGCSAVHLVFLRLAVRGEGDAEGFRRVHLDVVSRDLPQPRIAGRQGAQADALQDPVGAVFHRMAHRAAVLADDVDGVGRGRDLVDHERQHERKHTDCKDPAAQEPAQRADFAPKFFHTYSFLLAGRGNFHRPVRIGCTPLSKNNLVNLPFA